MTKELRYDLEFTREETIVPLSVAGLRFLEKASRMWEPKHTYCAATEMGLHVRFSHAELRDKITAGSV